MRSVTASRQAGIQNPKKKKTSRVRKTERLAQLDTQGSLADNMWKWTNEQLGRM